MDARAEINAVVRATVKGGSEGNYGRLSEGESEGDCGHIESNGGQQ